jgi:tRNA-splicing ligase RtcB
MTRPDPYRERARELCLAAGIDPDSRIEGPGQRSMPAWCAYREAARSGHMARKTAGAGATLPPQGPQFQNSPLKIFGRHDPATIAQMRNCMTVGNVVAGVVCADGHLGYAQPVGGVIAYEKQISISGVGFDIGCGNMAVRLDTPFPAISDRVGPIIKDVTRTISFGIGAAPMTSASNMSCLTMMSPGANPAWRIIAARLRRSSARSARAITMSI